MALMVCVTPDGCRGLLLCTACAGTADTGSLESTAVASDHLLQAAKVSTTGVRQRERGCVRRQRWGQREGGG